MRAAIHEQKKLDKKIPYFKASIRGHQVVLLNNKKSVHLFFTHDHGVQQMNWISENLVKDMEDGSEGIVEREGSENDESDHEDQESEDRMSFEDILKKGCSQVVSEAQRHTNCISIQWWKSRSSFAVKRMIEDGKNTEFKEFLIKSPKKCRKNVDRNGPSAAETLMDRFKTCLQIIQDWLSRGSESDDSLPDPQ